MAQDLETRGVVFNIQHFSIQDGPGIRTVVFLKGCPLRCPWCANPESQEKDPQLAWTKSECIGCGSCIKELQDLGIASDPAQGIVWNKSKVTEQEAFRVKRVCPAEALHVIGRYRTAQEVLDQVKEDVPFFTSSGGGMTLSGGEPLMQSAFSLALLRGAHDLGIRTCIETSGYAPLETFLEIAGELDNLIMDVKCTSTEVHRHWTGVDNTRIISNLRQIREKYPSLPIRLRTPMIPGVNDREEEIAPISALARELGCEYELLKYHTLGQPKFDSLHRFWKMGDAKLDPTVYESLKRYEVLDQSA